LLEKRSVASKVVTGDKVWLDSKHTPIDIPYKLSARWFGPFEVLSVEGAAVTLDLPETFGKAHCKVNIRHLKFYEERDSCFGDADGRPEPLISDGGMTGYEVRRICNARIHKGQADLWVEWKGYNQSQICWVHQDILMVDVPELVKAFDARPSTFEARASALKRATKGYKTPGVAQTLGRRMGLRSGVAD